MTSFEDVIWQDSVANHSADQVGMPRATHSSTRGYRSPRLAVGAGGVAAAAAAAAVLVFTGTSATAPAYALTANGNGSYTLTINDLQTAIPEVNAEFAKLGVHAKAIPVTSTCTAPYTGIPIVEDPKASMSESMTIDNANIPAGSTAFLAVEQLPDGHIGMSMGTTAASLPACLNSDQPVTIGTPTGPAETPTSPTGPGASTTSTGADGSTTATGIPTSGS